MSLLTEEEIFAAAMEKSPAERASFLDRVCAGDAGLRAEVEALLKAHEAPDSLLSPTGLQATIAPAAAAMERLGTMIGPYKLLEQIGEGGMGLVYMAEQQQPVRRLVALKLVKPGMDSKQVIARFEAERQALAMMDHPNIAKVLDAGMVGQASSLPEQWPAGGPPHGGRPFFVMELVRGVPINEFCDQQKLTVRQRLELFIHVCQAVQHAHQKGIIHRDLKPTNVLVTNADTVPLPKVIDFGIAKALGPALTDHTLHTGFAQLVGTPMYMSPEQAQMNHFGVDTRSDVYSLGVLLYELLTGTTPFDKETLSKAGLDEVRRMIREDEPETVSQRLAKTKSSRHTPCAVASPDGTRSVPTTYELDWIVMKALEKDRTRRYESASALAADIQRYLSDEPVLACPPTTMYRFQKFARKHRPAIAAVAAIALCLLLGTTVSAWQAVRATTAEAQANANEQKAVASAAAAEQKEQEAVKQRDEVKALADKLAAKDQQLQRTLYDAHMILAQRAWEAGAIVRVNELLDQHRPKPGETDLRSFEWHYLYKLCHQELIKLNLKLHARRAAFSPDGKRMAVGGGVWDAAQQKIVAGEVTMLDSQTGHELWNRKGHTSAAIGLAFSPDGKRLASVSLYSPIKVWDAATGDELHSFPEHRPNRELWEVTFSPDGKRLVCSGAVRDKTKQSYVDPEIRILDAETGQRLLTLQGAAGGEIFSPDGKCLASASDSDVKVWNAETGQELLVLKERINSAVFSADGKRLFGVVGSNVKVWDALTGNELHVWQGHAGPVRSVAISPDGKRVASGSDDKTVKVWDAETGAEVHSFKGHTGRVGPVMFIQDGARLASQSSDGTVRIWDVSTKQQGASFGGATDTLTSVCFSPDGKLITAISGDRDRPTRRDQTTREYAIKLWSSQTRQEILSLKQPAGKVPRVLAISPDCKRLAAGFGTREETQDSNRYKYVSNDVKVWDAVTGQEIATLKGHTWAVVGLSFSPDGSRLASCGSYPVGWGESDQDKPGEVKVWDVAGRKELLALQGHKSFVNSVAYSPDGQRLATLSRDNSVKIWDAQTGREILSLAVDVTIAGCVAFSPDGKIVASSHSPSWSTLYEGQVKLFSAQTGEELLTLKGHKHWVHKLVFSPDGKRLASTNGRASESWELKVWDAQTGEELLTFDKVGGGVTFSPDGHRLFSAGTEGLRIYDATPLPEKP